MEYYNVANYTGRLSFMWSGKFNNYNLESQGIFIVKQSGYSVVVGVNSSSCYSGSSSRYWNVEY